MLAVGPLGPQYCLLFAWYELGRQAHLELDTLPSQRVPRKILKKSISLYYLFALAPGSAGISQLLRYEWGRAVGGRMRCLACSGLVWDSKTVLGQLISTYITHTRITPLYPIITNKILITRWYYVHMLGSVQQKTNLIPSPRRHYYYLPAAIITGQQRYSTLCTITYFPSPLSWPVSSLSGCSP